MRLVAVHAYPALMLLVVAGNAVLAAWAIGADLLRGRRRLGSLFWSVLLAVNALIALQVASGIILALGGARPGRPLHFLYGILVIVGGLVQVGLRPGGFLRSRAFADPARVNEPRTLALLCFTELALVLRAFTTGGVGRL
jgi:hypothetical protein